MYRNLAKDQTDTSNDETDAPLFEQRIERDGDVSSGAENAARKNKDEEVSCGDFWEIDDAIGKYTYHHVMLRKRSFVPNKSEDGPNVADFENKRITHVTYVDGSDEYVVNDLWTDKGAQRAMPKYWKGTTIFYKKGYAPDSGASGSKEPGGVDLPPLPVSALAERKERKHRKSQKPNWIDSASWASISPALRADMIRQDKADKEL